MGTPNLPDRCELHTSTSPRRRNFSFLTPLTATATTTPGPFPNPPPPQSHNHTHTTHHTDPPACVHACLLRLPPQKSTPTWLSTQQHANTPTPAPTHNTPFNTNLHVSACSLALDQQFQQAALPGGTQQLIQGGQRSSTSTRDNTCRQENISKQEDRTRA